MPELPEVETIARELNKCLPRAVINSTRIFDPKLRTLACKTLKGATAIKAFRSGKQIIIELSKFKRKHFIAIHLRMTGRLLWIERESESIGNIPPRKHLRASFYTDKGELRFYDPRRFGTIRLHHKKDEFAPAGLEPLSRSFTPSALKKLLATSYQPIKIWLLRQDRVLGIGNIYASEILYLSGIHPQRLANSLSVSEIHTLQKSIRTVLAAAVRAGGTTFSDYQQTRGSSGSYQLKLKVYQLEGERCLRCRTEIERIIQQQRSTFFCPDCQRY